MADLAPRGAAQALDLAGGERREVVVQHELFGVVEPEVVHQAVVAPGAEGGGRQHLRLAAREDRGAVRHGQHARLDPDGSDLVGAAAVGAAVLVQHQPAHLGLFRLVVGGLELLQAVLGAVGLGVGHEPLEDAVAHGLDGVGPLVLARGEQRLAQAGRGRFARHGLDVGGIDLDGRLEALLGLADLLTHLRDQVDDRLEGLVGGLDGADHDVLGQFAGGGLDHHDGVLAGRHGELELRAAVLKVLQRRVDNVVAVHVADRAARRRPVPGHVADRQRGRGPDRSQRARIGLLVGREHRADDLDLVAELLGEQRTDLPVGDAGVQRGLLAGTALAAEERAGDLADGVVALFVLDGERQERQRRAAVVHVCGHQHEGVAVAHGDAAGDLLGVLAGLDDELTPSELCGVASMAG